MWYVLAHGRHSINTDFFPPFSLEDHLEDRFATQINKGVLENVDEHLE